MDQDFGSQCSSGCESGWTFYLGHSMYHYEKSKNIVDDEEEDDDDLSMVSDASSGPPHALRHQEQECNNDTRAFNGWNKEKIVKEARKIQDLTCYFDDTATSPFFNFSHVGDNQDIVEGDNVIVDYSKDHIKSKSRLQDQYGIFDSSVSAT